MMTSQIGWAAVETSDEPGAEEYRLDLVDQRGQLHDVDYLTAGDRDQAAAAARERLAAAPGCLFGHLYTTDHLGEIYVDTVQRPGA
jgi:hypothetical protein